jgi:hypothetical protein
MAFANQVLDEANIVREFFDREQDRVARTLDFMFSTMAQYRIALQHASVTQQPLPRMPDFAT